MQLKKMTVSQNAGDWRGGSYTSSLVLATGDEIGPIWAQMKVCHDIHVRAFVVEHFLSGLRIEQRDLARLVSHEDEIGHVGKCAKSRLRANGVKERPWFLRFCRANEDQ